MGSFAIGLSSKIYPVISAKSANYTITNTDGVDIFLVTTGSGANVVIDFPAASANADRRIKIVKADAGTKFVECKRQGSDTVRGSATSLYLIMQHEDAEFLAQGTDWVLLSNPLRTVGAEIGAAGAVGNLNGGTWISSVGVVGTTFSVNIITGVFFSVPEASLVIYDTADKAQYMQGITMTTLTTTALITYGANYADDVADTITTAAYDVRVVAVGKR